MLVAPDSLFPFMGISKVQGGEVLDYFEPSRGMNSFVNGRFSSDLLVDDATYRKCPRGVNNQIITMLTEGTTVTIDVIINSSSADYLVFSNNDVEFVGVDVHDSGTVFMETYEAPMA
jgi:hypothetical protein